MNTYEVGDLVQVSATFSTADGTPTDPSVIIFDYKLPNSVMISATPTRASAGVYTAQISVTMAGQYEYRFSGTGTVQAANEGAFFVNNSSFA